MRTLTFLFSDLREYTAFVERHGDVAATTLIADYRRLVRAEVAKATGAEVKTEGDSFYVVFDAATDAVRCAMAILREAERYSRGRPDRPMRVGIGIHAGEPQPHEGQYVGGAVIVAARLAQNAQGGELLVSDVVRGLLPKAALPPMVKKDDFTLKGIADPPRIFAVSWSPAEPAAAAAASPVSIEAAAPPDRAMLCPRLIGRESELSALGAFLDEVRGGHGRTILIAGEAGGGKSALLRRFLETASAAGARVLRGECTEVEARRPFGPLIDAFVSAGVTLPAELGQGGPGALPVAEVERYRVHAGFAEAIAGLASSGPVVVAIEDVHWADGATLELLPYLARKLRERRVLLLGTYRDDELHRLHPLRGTLAELKRSRLVTEVRLPRLTADEVGTMMQETLRLGRAPTTAFREAIDERCEGNPFFIEEVLRALVERGDLEYRDGAWRRSKDVADLAIPDSVRDAVQERLATLTTAARRALQVAAVIGQRFAFDLLLRVTALGEAELLGALRGAIDEQLIQEDEASRDDAYRFRHALTRESVLAELMRRERKLLHLEVAEAIEAASTDTADSAEELAYHFDEGGDAARAYRYRDLAAAQAERVFAYGQATEHLERAIELAPRDDPAVGALQLRLAEAAFASLDIARSIRAAEAARATFRAAGDARQEGAALSRLGTSRRTVDTEAGNRELVEALSLLEPLGASAELAFALARLAAAYAIDERTDEALALGRRAVDIGSRAGATEARLRGLLAVGQALWRHEPEEGLRTLREAARLAEEHGFAILADHVYQNLAAVLWHLGASRSELDAVLEEQEQHARRHGLRTDSQFLQRAFLAFRRGDWDEVRRLAEEGESDAQFAALRAGWDALVVVAREGPVAGAALVDAAMRLRGRRSSPRDIVIGAWLGVSAASLAGDDRTTLERAEAVTGQRTRTPFLDGVIIQAVLAALRVGDRRAAERWAELGAARASHFGYGAAVASRAVAEAAAALLRGEEDEALRQYEEAARALEDADDPLPFPFVRRARAEILARRGDLAAARAELEAVLPFWRKAKATWYLGELRAWAAERGIELTEPAAAART